MRDVFYFGLKPNVHPKEKHAVDLDDARNRSNTEHFWIINEFCDYKNFDWDFEFEFLADADVWAENHNNVWPSQHQKDSGTWLCPKKFSDIIVYRNDVNPIIRKVENNLKFYKQLDKIDTTKFDFSWHPDPSEPPYVYIWGSKFHSPDLMPVLEYQVPNGVEIKYMADNVELLPNTDCLVIKQKIDENKFDLTWRPDPREPPFIYIWGNKHVSAELESTLEYHVPNATIIKYMSEEIEVLPEYEKYKIFQEVTNFDFSWRPNPKEPPYIYIWGNKFIPAELKSTLEYHVPNSTEYKYMGNIDVKPEWDRWNIRIPVDETSFDFSWRPDPREPPFIYVFGNQWNNCVKEPTIEYHCENATDKKYVYDLIVKTLPNQNNFKVLLTIENFDFSWRPDPDSPPFIYVFGNQWNDCIKEPTVEYHCENATEKKYVFDTVATVPQISDNFKILISVEDFDFSWRPDPDSPPYIYVFGNKWNDAKTEPTVEYHCENATEYKYMDNPVAVAISEMKNWLVTNEHDLKTFDFSWRPNPFSPPQIYQWEDNGPCYIKYKNTEVVYMERTIENQKHNVNKYFIKTNLLDLIQDHKDEVFWALNPDLNYNNFDFSWKPNQENFKHINVFGNEYSKNTQTYFINGPMFSLGYQEYNYIENKTFKIESSNIDMFYIDKSNSLSKHRFEILKEKYPQLQQTRYLNSWVETITRCCAKSNTKFFWVLSSELDYSDFVFDFYPSPWQEKMVHVFGTQWSHWGNTYFINKETFTNDTKYIKIIEHLSILNFVKTKKAKATDVVYDIVYIDHGNFDMSELKDQNRLIVKYKDSYLETFKEMIKQLPDKKEYYVWAISTVCNYKDFDFTYICDPFSKEHLHVFPSNSEKFGDTFFINVNKLKSVIDELTELTDYNKINFNNHQKLSRLPAPVIISNDSHTDSIKNDFDFPYAIFVTEDNKNLLDINTETIPLWDTKTKNILITSEGGTKLIVPKEAKSYVKTELYDYPYIKKNHTLLKSNFLDIIFISNGEKNSEENYQHLLTITKDLPNKIQRVDKVKGRIESQHAAAKLSNTPWYFLINAKLYVNKDFDFGWQPDRLQIPKHYIFTASNPVTGLQYGHQAIVANNKNLTLNTIVKGLDFTMDSEHEVVNINSGIGKYNSSPWDTWRTAFREVIKLRYNNTRENENRLKVWINVAEGKYKEYSLQGAKDALEFFESVNGDFEALKLSYEWLWLNEYFNNKYK